MIRTRDVLIAMAAAALGASTSACSDQQRDEAPAVQAPTADEPASGSEAPAAAPASVTPAPGRAAEAGDDAVEPDPDSEGGESSCGAGSCADPQ